MWTLKPPVESQDEDKTLASIIKKNPLFTSHKSAWETAYATYRVEHGNPWKVTATVFDPPIKDEQLRLYESRKSGGPIKRIRNTPGIRCCPVCGSPSIGTLDHYLPKDAYPEFAVLPSNLIPACGLCNSGAKGVAIKGTLQDHRFLHPYFDKSGDQALWEVSISGNFAAPTFKAVPSPGISGSLLGTLIFHLEHVLGDQFYVQMGTYWSDLPQAISDQLLDGKAGQQSWDTELKWSIRTLGLNGWRSALIRGVRNDMAARSYVDAQAHALVQGSMRNPQGGGTTVASS